MEIKDSNEVVKSDYSYLIIPLSKFLNDRNTVVDSERVMILWVTCETFPKGHMFHTWCIHAGPVWELEESLGDRA